MNHIKRQEFINEVLREDDAVYIINGLEKKFNLVGTTFCRDDFAVELDSRLNEDLTETQWNKLVESGLWFKMVDNLVDAGFEYIKYIIDSDELGIFQSIDDKVEGEEN